MQKNDKISLYKKYFTNKWNKLWNKLYYLFKGDWLVCFLSLLHVVNPKSLLAIDVVNLFVNFLHLSNNSKFLRVRSSLSNVKFTSSLTCLSEKRLAQWGAYRELPRLNESPVSATQTLCHHIEATLYNKKKILPCFWLTADSAHSLSSE